MHKNILLQSKWRKHLITFTTTAIASRIQDSIYEKHQLPQSNSALKLFDKMFEPKRGIIRR